MQASARTLFWGTSVLAVAAALSGCVVAPAPYYQGGYAGGGVVNSYGEVVTVAPPAPYVETVGVAPVPGYIWFGGYWNWAGGRHVWTPGHWGPGRAGHAWVPHEWVRSGSGWRLNGGHWRRH